MMYERFIARRVQESNVRIYQKAAQTNFERSVRYRENWLQTGSKMARTQYKFFEKIASSNYASARRHMDELLSMPK